MTTKTPATKAPNVRRACRIKQIPQRFFTGSPAGAA
jgi:hypothetical protein